VKRARRAKGANEGTAWFYSPLPCLCRYLYNLIFDFFIIRMPGCHSSFSVVNFDADTVNAGIDGRSAKQGIGLKTTLHGI